MQPAIDLLPGVDPNEAAIAHVLRRLTFGPHPGRAAALAASTDAATVIEDLLADPADTGEPPPEIEENDPAGSLIRWYVRQLANPAAGLHERMCWYWHTHLTSSVDAASVDFMLQQHLLVRRHALGNFRTLLREITTDPAMLQFLDGDGSGGESPNENYARELMELFALGVGNYTEDDVRAAARALSGWGIEWDDATSYYWDDRGYDRPVTIFGERKRWDVDSVIDAVVEHEACAPHVAGRMWEHLVGTELADDRRGELATVFRDADYEILPLVAAIVRSPEFLESSGARARTPLEWYIAALVLTGQVVDDELNEWELYALGQVPFAPPNVAGWPLDDRWLSGSQYLLRASTVLDHEVASSIINNVEPTVDAVARHCGV